MIDCAPTLFNRFRALAGMRRFGRDQRGVTAIEFGILGLPFFAIIGAILETSMVFLTSQALDSAVNDASRLIRTGQARAYTAEQFKTRVCSQLYTFITDCDGLLVRVEEVVKFSDAQTSAPTDPTCTKDCDWKLADSYDAGQGSSIVMVQVFYKWPLIINMPMLGMADQGDGTRLMAAVRVFRNEPFTGSSS